MEWLISRRVHGAAVAPQRAPLRALVSEFARWWLATYACVGCVAGVQGDLASRKSLDAHWVAGKTRGDVA